MAACLTAPEWGARQGIYNGPEWCAEIMRITPLLGLAPILAERVKPRGVKEDPNALLCTPRSLSVLSHRGRAVAIQAAQEKN
jgi:hypothetical protein